MGRKPKAGGAEGKRTDPEQSARFLEAARQAGVDETGEAFERAFEKVAQTGETKVGAARRRRPSTGGRPKDKA